MDFRQYEKPVTVTGGFIMHAEDFLRNKYCVKEHN